jgi:D-3-phosphoglycerate dehydrogenase / 2-oxoglutarate reductase
MARILVTPRSLTLTPHPAIEALRERGHEVVYSTSGQQPGEAELERLVPSVEGWLAGVEPVSEAVIARADGLRVISRNGVGVDNLPMPTLARRGIAVRTAEGANAAGVAELAIALMLSALRHVPSTDRGIKAGQWPRLRGREIRDRRVGVVGCGAIGGEVARLAVALGASVIAFDPARPSLPIPPERLRFADLPELLREAEILTLHCPAPKNGRPLIEAPALTALPRGAILVNTARAALVDEDALIAALDEGQISAYAADVFAEEPPRSLALAGHPRVIATSHIGGFTEESVDRATEVAVANLLESLGDR